jgi:hypothetical protein
MMAMRVTPKAVIFFVASLPALCSDWNPRLAAQYLDARQKEWTAWKPAAAQGGTCFSCHTGMTYLLARPLLRRALGESEPTPYEKSAVEGLRARLGLKEPLDSQKLGVESIFAAWFLVRSPEGEQALDRMWAFQRREGDAKGSFPWFSLSLDPWEMPESAFYGAALAALAAGSAPAEYRERPEIRERVGALTAYLQNQQASQPLHNRIMLLWVASVLPEVLPKASRTALIEELLSLQRYDGGWTIAALGPWKAHSDAPTSAGSNSYATAFATYVLLQAGLPSSNPKVAGAAEWLRNHQDPQTGSWNALSMNKSYPRGSMPEGFLRDATTGFAAAALLSIR